MASTSKDETRMSTRLEARWSTRRAPTVRARSWAGRHPGSLGKFSAQCSTGRRQYARPVPSARPWLAGPGDQTECSSGPGRRQRGRRWVCPAAPGSPPRCRLARFRGRGVAPPCLERSGGRPPQPRRPPRPGRTLRRRYYFAASEPRLPASHPCGPAPGAGRMLGAALPGFQGRSQRR